MPSELLPRPLPWWQRLIKRILDLIISVAGLALLLPLIIYVSIRVALSSKGPVVYSQERIGLNGRKFRIMKFRSMYKNAEDHGPQLSSPDDTRITPWGRTMRKWKIDEIPQLWNVIAGEMSIVGPRPERAFFIAQLEQRGLPYRALLAVRPGITSLGMVKYGYASDLEQMAERMKFDVEYLRQRSLSLDLKIMLSTLRIISSARGR